MVNGLDIGALKERVDIVGIIDSYTQLKRLSDDSYTGKCPFHDDHSPSLSVTPSKGLFHCFGCEAGGDAIDFLQRVEGVPFNAALSRAASMAGVAPGNIPRVVRRSNGSSEQPKRVTEQTSVDKPRVVAIYRYVNEQRELLYEVLRSEPKSFRQRRPNGVGWDWNLDGVPRVLYHLPEVLAADEVVVVEGEKDADALAERGLVGTTNAGGANQKWKPEWTKALSGKRVVIIPDADEPGRKRAAQIARELSAAAEVTVVELPNGHKDVSDYFEAGFGIDDLQELISQARERQQREALERKGLLLPKEIIQTIEGGFRSFMYPPRGLETGYPVYDRLTCGLHAGEMSVLAARPAMGKTSLALNIGAHVADAGKTVAIFSLEMSRRALLTRMVLGRASVDQVRFRDGVLDQEERRRVLKAFNELAERNLLIDDSALTIEMITKRLHAMHSLDLVIVDYLQLMAGQRKENRNTEIGSLSRGLKLLAGELRVPFLVLSQLSRAPETRTGNPRPQLSDLRDSGQIEQDADVVAFIFREEVYKPNDESLHGKAELIVAKQRNGPTGKCRLHFSSRYTRFSDDPAEAIA